ncbi:hypothetical protein GCM10007920_39500 [Ciceribacter naphthalenivorans]|uniref:Uncharacterized protein n=2 Tax=Alphaproteobacteria TaxID=28211 RepID=A0A512HE11_9HYPH|nr:hypothetical protein RNA01_06240 [Ciceribacter naphthalenivorans]GLR24156.1 hypothetical protein GCM10007920_39500 [Ciceribacter naphthalenivorans]GLT07012.1 hypothetical protein GCM10007926_39500 [Sphingomonas psychrolutea]
MQRRLDPLAAFSHRLVGQSDNMHVDLARRDHYLDINRNAFNPLECNRTDTRYHCPPPRNQIALHNYVLREP